jgi:methylated-DNA-[protein]-cysteine S-methyltransferase
MNVSIPFPELEQLYLLIRFTDEGIITDTEFTQSAVNSDTVINQPFKQKILTEFACYFQHSSHQLELDYQFVTGTPFQQKVWRALTHIPAGQVMTYGSLARELNTSARAVGNACRKNPIPMIVPCHRVVAANDVGGFAGDTEKKQKGKLNFLQIKRWLLAHEQAQ